MKPDYPESKKNYRFPKITDKLDQIRFFQLHLTTNRNQNSNVHCRYKSTYMYPMIMATETMNWQPN